MKRTIAARWCERDSRRILLAIGLPLVGPVTALGMGAFLLMAGVRSDAALRSIFMATVLSTLIATAVFTPRTIDGGQYSVLRKCFAGVAGIAAATLVVRTLAFVGIDAEALSNPSRHPAYFWWALFQEGTMIASFYGTMFFTAFVVLGQPRSEAPE